VAFRFDGRQIYVAPRSQVPEGSTAFSKSTAMEAAQFELVASVDDFVDGPNSGCLTTNAALNLARSELDRLGLQDWIVVSGVRGDRPSHPCAGVSRDPNRLALVVVANDREDREALRRSDAIASSVFTLRDALRKGIADK